MICSLLLSNVTWTVFTKRLVLLSRFQNTDLGLTVRGCVGPILPLSVIVLIITITQYYELSILFQFCTLAYIEFFAANLTVTARRVRFQSLY